MIRSLFAVLLTLSTPLAAQAQEIKGIWKTEATDQGYLEVQIAPCGPALCGTILRARDLQGREQPYEHTGKQMIRDMAPTGANTWGNGQIWDPRNNRTFRSKMKLSGNQLAVSGCVLGICQAQNWQRAR